MKYNLSCGNKKYKNYINLDKNECNLNKSFVLKDCEEVLLYHGLEHLDNQIFTMAEIYRNLVKGGVIKMSLPCFSPHLYHKSWFHDENYLDCLTGKMSDVCLQSKNNYKVRKIEYRMQDKFIGFTFIDFIKRLLRLLKCLWYYEIYFEIEKR